MYLQPGPPRAFAHTHNPRPQYTLAPCRSFPSHARTVFPTDMISVLPLLVLAFIHFFMIFIHPHLGVSEAVTQYLVVEGGP
jgi:hypothetical protein